MSSYDFIQMARQRVLVYAIEHTDPMAAPAFMDDILLVWYCKTLQNNKALLFTPLLAGMYFEATYNGDKDELYLDAYRKQENIKYDGNRR